jgi:dTDP-4-dehydrorhamnose reductase
MKILLTGANGQVGFETQRSLPPLGEVVALDHTQCDLARPDELRRVIREVRPDVIVNAAAYTAVDKAQSDAELAMAVNGIAPGIIGEVAAKSGALVVHYSTDYVFDGKKETPYVETDLPNPQSGYGASKWAGEQALRDSGAHFLTLRTSWVYGAHGGNFAKTILRLAGEREELRIVADQHGAPTAALRIAAVTAEILKHYQRVGPRGFRQGLYHLAAGGATTWHEYAQNVVRTAYNAGRTFKLRPERIKPISTAEYPLPAPRPANSRLDTTKLSSVFGIPLPDWRSDLQHVIKEILK